MFLWIFLFVYDGVVDSLYDLYEVVFGWLNWKDLCLFIVNLFDYLVLYRYIFSNNLNLP